MRSKFFVFKPRQPVDHLDGVRFNKGIFLQLPHVNSWHYYCKVDLAGLYYLSYNIKVGSTNKNLPKLSTPAISSKNWVWNSNNAIGTILRLYP